MQVTGLALLFIGGVIVLFSLVGSLAGDTDGSTMVSLAFGSVVCVVGGMMRLFGSRGYANVKDPAVHN